MILLNFIFVMLVCYYTSTTLNVFDNSSYFADSDYSVLNVYYLWHVSNQMVLWAGPWVRPQSGDYRGRRIRTRVLLHSKSMYFISNWTQKNRDIDNCHVDKSHSQTGWYLVCQTYLEMKQRWSVNIHRSLQTNRSLRWLVRVILL